MGWQGEERRIYASAALFWDRMCPQGGGREVERVVEKERSEAAAMSLKQEVAGRKGRWGGAEGWRWGPAVWSAMKKLMEYK